MKTRAQSRRPQTIEQARAELASRLELRRPEIEAAVITRVYSVSDPGEMDPTYAEGLRAAIKAAVDYGLAAIELGEDRSEPPPPLLLAQARMAARNGIGLDTVLRRYFAGHALLGDFLVEEAEGGRLLRGAALQRILRTQAALFDRLLEAVSEEHGRELDRRPPPSKRRQAEQVERLLAGELVDTTSFGYDFDAHHVGLIASGAGAVEVLHDLAHTLGRRLLQVVRDETTVWAWLGGRRAPDLDDVERIASASRPVAISLAAGEPASGLSGWRLTHRQARATLPIAIRSQGSFTRYADVALPAAILRDDLLATSLQQLYLEPLERAPDGGRTLRVTLRAYFEMERNMTSAAAALGVSRNTVASRLRTAEATIGRPLAICGSEVDVALRMAELL